LLGGAALLFGAFIAWASVPAIVVLLTAMFTVHLRTASVPSKSRRSWMVGRNSDLRGTNATFSISRASWLSGSSAQARGPSIAIVCGSVTPAISPSFPDDEGVL
jgi:hypothetical protein